MKTRILLLVPALSLFTVITSLHAQATAFTYQGRLNDGTNPTNGQYDLRFAIYDAASAGTQQGSLLTNSAIAISNGLVTVALDFGNQFNGTARWLEIAVRTNNASAFTVLSPRQQLTPAPYAIFATTASNLSGALPAAQLSGTVPSADLSGIYPGPVTFNNPGDSFSGNGTGLTNVNAATLNSLNAGNFWQLGGNNVSSGQLLGCTNNQLLDLYANGVRALRLVLRTDGLATFTNAPNVIGGSSANLVNSTNIGGTVGGGGGYDTNGTSYPNSVTGDFGTVSGGYVNTAGGVGATVSGGHQNTASGAVSLVGGGFGNTASADEATVGGGFGNTASGQLATAVGGALNTASGDYSAVSGGYGNTAGAIGSFIGGGGYDGTSTVGNKILSKAATIGGGLGNDIPGGAEYAFIGGGDFNTNSGVSGTLSGGEDNTVSGNYATVPGGKGNSAQGKYSFAAGFGAYAAHDGCFVWSDDNNFVFGTTVSNLFAARCTGGVAFVTGINAGGNPNAGVTVLSGGTSWLTICDRNAKKNFQPVSGEDVLEKLAAMPVQSWNYKWESDTSTPHLGPMAQDFKAAFYPGRDDKSISTLEFDGVELAAIQGLNQKLNEKEMEIAELKHRLEALEKIIRSQKSN